jgi:hypothetical protein
MPKVTPAPASASVGAGPGSEVDKPREPSATDQEASGHESPAGKSKAGLWIAIIVFLLVVAGVALMLFGPWRPHDLPKWIPLLGK